MPSKLFVVLAHLVSGVGCEIRLYRFLIIAFSATSNYWLFVQSHRLYIVQLVYKDEKTALCSQVIFIYRVRSTPTKLIRDGTGDV